MKKIFLMLCLAILSIGANAQCPIDIERSGTFIGVSSTDSLTIDIRGTRVLMKYRDQHAEVTDVDAIRFAKIEGEYVRYVEVQYDWETLTLVLIKDQPNRIGVVTDINNDEYGDPFWEVTFYNKTS